jgi:hypothetical protein
VPKQVPLVTVEKVLGLYRGKYFDFNGWGKAIVLGSFPRRFLKHTAGRHPRP